MILFEDNHILVAEKKAGELTQPTEFEPSSLETTLKELIKKRDQKPGAVFLHAVHRLDRPVGGLALFAKSRKALSRLNAAQREKQFQKEYLALVSKPLSGSGVLEHFLRKADYKAEIVSEKSPGAKKSVLKFSAEGEYVTVELVTGRYHQIRAQLSAVGAPIVGDSKYGGASWNKEGIALHHTKLTFKHPVTKEVLTFSSKPNY